MEIDKRLPYRIGSQLLPVLPVETESADVHHPGLGVAIYTTLADRGILYNFVVIVHRYHRGDTNRPVTILISTEYKDGCTKKWIDAIKALHQYLLANNLDYIIEFIDYELWMPTSPPVAIDSADHATIQSSRTLVPQIRELIAQYKWLAIDVLNWQTPVHRRPLPTIVISTQDAHLDSWWRTTLPAIKQLIKESDNNSHLDVQLLFLEDICLTAAEEDNRQEPDPTVLDKSYDHPIPIGSSCGRSGSKSSGTLGGKIVLRKDGEDIELGLTNSHVLLQGATMVDDTSQGGDHRALELNAGPFYPSPELAKITVSIPSDRDHETAVAGFKRSIQETTSQIKDRPSTQPLSLREQQSANRLEFKLQTATTNLLATQHAPREIGTIYAASGHTTCDAPLGYTSNEWKFCAKRYPPPYDKGWALDWCLFKPHENVSLHSKVYELPSTLLGPDTPEDAHIDIKNWAAVHPEKRYNVMKRGRLTGWTQGTIGAVPSTVNMLNGPPRVDEDAKTTIVQTIFPNKFGDKAVSSHCIVSTSRTHDGRFILPGDSGSFVLHDNGNEAKGENTVLGLCFASNESSKASYMIPMQLVVNSINEVTKGEVVQPKKVELA